MPKLGLYHDAEPIVLTSASGTLTRSGSGKLHVRQDNLAAASAPGVQHDSTAGYEVGSTWLDTTGGNYYVCTSAAEGAATWIATVQSTMQPGGSDTQIQYNSSGAFAGSANLTWSSLTLGVHGQVAITSGAAGTVPLTITGASGQTANLLEVTSYGGVAGGIACISSAGTVTLGGTTYVKGTLYAEAGLRSYNSRGAVTPSLFGVSNSATYYSAMSGNYNIAEFGFVEGAGICSPVVLMWDQAAVDQQQFGPLVGPQTNCFTVGKVKYNISPATGTVPLFQVNSGGVATFFGPAVFTGGTVAAPAITFTGDTNTGLYSPGADQVAITTGGTAKVTVDASGNVTLPTADARIIGINADSFVQIGNSYLRFNVSSGGVFDWYNGLTQVARLNGSGYLGIGTASPSGKLEVYGGNILQNNGTYLLTVSNGAQISGSNHLILQAAGSYATLSATNNIYLKMGLGTTYYLSIGDTSDNEFARFTHDGKFGIGITSPDNLLHLRKSPNIGMGSVTATGGLATDWNVVSQIKIDHGASGGNALAFFVSGTDNERKAFIQSGHSHNNYANNVGTLALNPFGGNVGIGIASPSSQLALYTTTSPAAQVTLDADSGNRRLTITPSVSPLYGGMIGMTTAHPLSFMTNNATCMTIGSSGNVGIGVTSAEAALHIVKTSLQLRLGYDAAKYASFTTSSTGKLTIESSNNEVEVYNAVLRVNHNSLQLIDYIDAGSKKAQWGLYFFNSYASASPYADISLATRTSHTDIDLGFTVNASERMRITATGNVGIGTTGPQGTLHVASANVALGNWGNVAITSTDAMAADRGGHLSFGGIYNTGGGIACFADIVGAKDNSTDANTGGYLAFATRNATTGVIAERMRIGANGNVGIGYPFPTRQLHVYSGTVDTIIRAEYNSVITEMGTASGVGFIGATSNNAFTVRTNNTERVRIDAAGNVGIGTTSPSALIHGIKTTEQLRLGYNAANYTSFTTNSGGDLAIAPSGGNLTVTAADVDIASDKSFYLGDPATDGTWRITRSGNNLLMERRESGSYVTKQTIAA